MSKWQMSRIQYCFGLGILVATWIHFPAPRALFVFAIASMLTALRFRALGWKLSPAFTPVGIAAVGTALIMIMGPSSKASVFIAHLWRGAAVLAQLGITVRAVLAHSARDPISPRQGLALNFLGQRRRTKRMMDNFKPQIEAHRRATQELDALRAELADHVATHGDKPSAERTCLTERLAEQTLLVQASTEDLRAGTAKMRAESDALRSATEAWKNRNNGAG
jgi:hypothetical protein